MPRDAPGPGRPDRPPGLKRALPEPTIYRDVGGRVTQRTTWGWPTPGGWRLRVVLQGGIGGAACSMVGDGWSPRRAGACSVGNGENAVSRDAGLQARGGGRKSWPARPADHPRDPGAGGGARSRGAAAQDRPRRVLRAAQGPSRWIARWGPSTSWIYRAQALFQSGQPRRAAFLRGRGDRESDRKINRSPIGRRRTWPDYMINNTPAPAPPGGARLPSIGCAPARPGGDGRADPRRGLARPADKDECGIHFVDGKMVRGPLRGGRVRGWRPQGMRIFGQMKGDRAAGAADPEAGLKRRDRWTKLDHARRRLRALTTGPGRCPPPPRRARPTRPASTLDPGADLAALAPASGAACADPGWVRRLSPTGGLHRGAAAAGDGLHRPVAERRAWVIADQ